MIYLLKKNWEFLGSNKSRFCFAVFLTLPLAALKSYQAYHIKNVIDVGFLSESSINAVTFQCLILLGLQLLQMPLRVFYLSSLKSIAEFVSLKVREVFFEKLKSIELKRVQSMDAGSLLSVSVSDIRFFSESLREVVVLISEPLSCFGFLFVAFYHDWQLALLVLGIIPVFILILKFTGSKIKKHSKKAQDDFALLTQKASESLEGNITLKSYNLQNSFEQEFSEINETYSNSKIRAISYEQHSSPLIEFVGTILMCGILLFARERMSAGHLTTGEFISFFTALGLFMGPLKKINNANKALSRGQASMQRIDEILSQKAHDREKLFINKANVSFESLEFRNVSFSYEDRDILKNVSFKISKGEKVAFIGMSGSGKSTITYLLLGLFEAQSGDIFINSKNIKSLSLDELRSFFEYVPQAPYFFESTYLENLQFGNKIDVKELEFFMDVAQIDFLSSKEILEDNKRRNLLTSFSGGQLQRLALLRCLMSQKSFLILDEATSALDTDTERNIISKLYDCFEGKTFLCVAHKLNTIESFEKIFVLRDGRIIEQGKHEDLLELNGSYAELYKLGNYTNLDD